LFNFRVVIGVIIFKKKLAILGNGLPFYWRGRFSLGGDPGIPPEDSESH
jgi:hypothetical protein